MARQPRQDGGEVGVVEGGKRLVAMLPLRVVS